MKKIVLLVIFLAVLAIVVPVLAKNSDFTSILNKLWVYVQDFSSWIINEIQKLIHHSK